MPTPASLSGGAAILRCVPHQLPTGSRLTQFLCFPPALPAPLALSVFWDQLPNKPLAPRFLTQGLLLRKRQPVTSHPQAFPHPRPPLGQALSVRAPRGPRAPAMAWVSPEDPDPLLLPLSVPTLT